MLVLSYDDDDGGEDCGVLAFDIGSGVPSAGLRECGGVPGYAH